MRLRVFLGLPLLTLLICAGCRSAYYSTMEKFGVYKRDLLKKSVVAAEAIASLKGETSDIQNEISKLLSDMDAAIRQADSFINSMP